MWAWVLSCSIIFAIQTVGASQLARYPVVIFPQATVGVDNICFADFGATVKTIKPVTYCQKWKVSAKLICSNGESEYCQYVPIEQKAGMSEQERFEYICEVSKTEILSTPLSYLRTYCDEYTPDSSDQASLCVKWATQWATWPYKYTYEMVNTSGDSEVTSGPFRITPPKCSN
ncbi:MAG: hypothetical protein IPM57_03425 [Oligoflexia bacterium]|nr:hypothetical protein [Oligoflexia bacterium]